jgi:hypothetical protein
MQTQEETTAEKQFVFPEAKAEFEHHVRSTKQHRQDLDAVLQNLRKDCDRSTVPSRGSRERSIAITKLQEAIMWLGMDLKSLNAENPGVSPNPYPNSYNPDSLVIEPTADGLKM